MPQGALCLVGWISQTAFSPHAAPCCASDHAAYQSVLLNVCGARAKGPREVSDQNLLPVRFAHSARAPFRFLGSDLFLWQAEKKKLLCLFHSASVSFLVSLLASWFNVGFCGV